MYQDTREIGRSQAKKAKKTLDIVLFFLYLGV
jgi:hypothetical protein